MTFTPDPCPSCNGPRVVVLIHAGSCNTDHPGPCAGWDAVCSRCAARARDAGAAKDAKPTVAEVARVRAIRNYEIAARRRAETREAL